MKVRLYVGDMNLNRKGEKQYVEIKKNWKTKRLNLFFSCLNVL